MAWTWKVLPVFLLVTFVASAPPSPSGARRAHSTEHIDKLSETELLNILSAIEDSATPAPKRNSYPYASGGSSQRVSAPTPFPSTRRPAAVPSRFPTNKPSSDIDALLDKYRRNKGASDAPTADDLLRRLRNAQNPRPTSTFQYPGPAYSSPTRPSSYGSSGSYPSSRSSSSYPSSNYPSSHSSSYPSRSASPTSYVPPSYPSTYPTQRYPSAPSSSSGYSSSGSYSPSGSYGGHYPKSDVGFRGSLTTTTKKPKKGFLSRVFG